MKSGRTESSNMDDPSRLHINVRENNTHGREDVLSSQPTHDTMDTLERKERRKVGTREESETQSSANGKKVWHPGNEERER